MPELRIRVPVEILAQLDAEAERRVVNRRLIVLAALREWMEHNRLVPLIGDESDG